MKIYLIALFAFQLMLAATCSAEQILVGSGADADFSSVREAVLAAQSGDVVAIQPGLYAEGSEAHTQVWVSDLSIVGLGATPGSTTIVDLRLWYRVADGHRIENLRFTGDDTVIIGGTFVMEGCVFESIADKSFGGIVWPGPGSLVVDCDFIGNTISVTDDGAPLVFSSFSGDVENCFFVDNTSTGYGAVALSGPSQVTGSVFVGNRGEFGGLGSYHECCDFGSHPVLSRCTFWGNEVVGMGGAINLLAGYAEIERCIVAGTIGGAGAVLADGGNVRCSDFWDNEDGGLLCGGCSTTNNYSVDPMFCDPSNNDFYLSPDSPCADPLLHLGLPCESAGAFLTCQSSSSPMEVLGDDVFLRVFPNPARSAPRLSFQVPYAGSYCVRLYDVAGALEGESWLSLEAGPTIASLPSSADLVEGVYYVRIQGKALDLKARFVLLGVN